MRFVDTNVLLYAISKDPAEQAKAGTARALLDDADLVLSTQVLQEFFVQATRATRSDALSIEQASALVDAFSRFTVQDITLPIVRAAMRLQARAGLSYWDCAIVEAAREAGCDTVLSEDLSHGQDLDGVIAVNPFI